MHTVPDSLSVSVAVSVCVIASVFVSRYHPDTTALPIEVAAAKFLQLKEAHRVLSSQEERRLYDWQLYVHCYLSPPYTESIHFFHATMK